MPVDKQTFDAVRKRVIATAPAGMSRDEFNVLLDSELAKIDTKPVEPIALTPTVQTPERSYGDMLRSVRDTAAEFLPMAGAAIGSTFGGVPGALTGQAAGQGYRGLIQRGGELPAAIADIYRNLQSGDPDVRGATMRGFQRGADEGKINLVPGGRGSQAAVANLRAGNPYAATADTLGALLDVGMVSGAAPIAKAFTTNAPRATIGTLLGLTGSKLGGPTSLSRSAWFDGGIPHGRVVGASEGASDCSGGC